MPAALRAAVAAVLVAVAYVATGLLALKLAIPPSYATPIYPPAGLALAAVLVMGRMAWPAVALGAFVVNWSLSAARGEPSLDALAVPVIVGLGAMAQAALGAWLVRRGRDGHTTLSDLREIVRFFVLAGPLACLVNAILATSTLSLVGVLAPQDRLITAWTWWAGDTMGVLIGAPIALTLFGRPSEFWRPRRTTVGLPLLAVTLLLGVGTHLVAQREQQRIQSDFDRTAGAAADAMATQLREPLHAVEAMRSLFVGSSAVSQPEMARAAEGWLNSMAGLQALGYSVNVPRAEIRAFEAQVRATGLDAFRVFDRHEIDPAALASDRSAVVVRMIAPLSGNMGALGVNALSVPSAREAIQRAARTDAPAASAAFTLTQDPQGREGIVVYRGIYGDAPVPASESDRIDALTGVVFATVRIDDLARRVMGRAPTFLRWCLSDITREPAHTLAGDASCAAHTQAGNDLKLQRVMDVAGRRWELRLTTAVTDLPYPTRLNAWLFSSVGLGAVAVLGALLLTVTGRARRVEQLVALRTADLQHEINERQRTQEALQEAMLVRERTQAELRESQRHLRTIVDHAPIGVRYTDLHGRLLEVNPAFCQLTGYGPAELIGMDIAMLHHPDDRATARHAFLSVVRGQPMAEPLVCRYITHDHQTRWVRLMLRLVGTAGDPTAKTVGVVEDITEHLQLRAAEQARQAAEAASRTKSEFVSRMSHELRTPLNAMLGFAQLLELDQRPMLAPHQAEWTAQIQQAGWHLLHMINDTLDLSRIETGTLRLDTVPVDLAGVVKASVDMVASTAARRNIRIEQRLDPSCRHVLGDATRVKQVLINLLSNAVKYNVDGGSVRLRTVCEGATVRIEVRDSGIGMDAEQLKQLFQPFNRLGRERSSAEGTGIGLVIARRLAELMGGSLEVASEVGQGSEFIFMMPRPEPNDAAPRSDVAQAEETSPNYHQRVVHYIEDNETNVEVMRGILAQRPQVRMIVSTDGRSGLEALRAQPPSLVLLDLNLPDMAGLDLLRLIREDIALADVPVVVVSADATTRTIEQAFAAGATDYVTKPINLAGILAVIDRALTNQDTTFGGI